MSILAHCLFYLFIYLRQKAATAAFISTIRRTTNREFLKEFATSSSSRGLILSSPCRPSIINSVTSKKNKLEIHGLTIFMFERLGSSWRVLILHKTNPDFSELTLELLVCKQNNTNVMQSTKRKKTQPYLTFSSWL